MKLNRARRAWDRLKVHPIGRILGMRRRESRQQGKQKKRNGGRGDSGREVDTYA